MSFAIVVGEALGTGRDCHLDIDGTAFPAAPWRDRPVVLLGWWIENHLAMRESGTAAHNSFMEGPYEFVVAPAGEDIEVTLVRRARDDDVTVDEHAISAREYEAALLRAGDTAAASAAPDKDLETLRGNLEALRRLLS